MEVYADENGVVKATKPTLTRREEILVRLQEIDRLALRPLRKNETARLAEFESEAESLRKELKAIK